jgi:type I restriction enzyme, S subunit
MGNSLLRRSLPFGDVLDGGTRNGIYKSKEFHGHGAKIINMGELFAFPRMHAVPMKRIALTNSERCKFEVLPGDLLFARRSLVADGAGKCSIVLAVDECTVFESSIIRARPAQSKADSLYLYYLFSSPHGAHLLDTIRRDAVVAGITGKDLVRLPVELPNPKEQRAIAHVLGTLDDKIELNRRMNETLEAMARALFKSWFVDFDPVHAKAEGRQPPGMDPATAALFPRAFQDSDLGSIPKGWQHAPVRQVCQGLFDGPHATPPEADSGAVFLGIKNFTPTSLDLTSVRYISEDDWPRWTQRVEPRHEDIVFTYEATLGFFALIPPDLRCCLGRRTALIRPQSDARDSHYLFHWFIAPPFQEFLRAHRQPGSTVDRIWLKDFPEYPVLQPPRQLVHLFEEQVRLLWSRIHANQSEMATLARLRDALLPRLLSGELSVGKAMKAVEATA